MTFQKNGLLNATQLAKFTPKVGDVITTPDGRCYTVTKVERTSGVIHPDTSETLTLVQLTLSDHIAAVKP